MNTNPPRQNTWQIATQIVADAAEMPAGERDAFVISRCGENVALLAEVRSLLAHLDGIEGYIEEPVVLPSSAIERVSMSGRPIGPYVLGEEVGAGGMGVVYAAERADGSYKQKVAIKLLRGGGSGADDARRMARERQALAHLDHPNIARLLDGGTTPDGAPYIVMEYVEGVSIDAYCEREKLGLCERVALVRGVCAAIQSAHQRLLIHRDIKPSNVLVTKDGTPKLLDFGIARLLEVESEDQKPIAATQATALLFTPRYASPEQVRGQPVTVATDVYGLGLLLYELLAGTSPYERIASSKASSAADAMVAVIQDAPRRASEVARLAGNTAPFFAAKQLEGELDTILLKACAKLPAERYQTVAQLNEDLARWLEGKPILARPQSLGYTLLKLAGRHRIATAATTLATLAIVAGVAGTVMQKNRAEARYEQVRVLANSFIFKYYDAIESLPGSKPVIKDMIGDGLKFFDDLSVDVADNPTLAAEIAAGYIRLSTAQYNARGLPSTGDRAGSAAAAAKARAILDVAIAKAPDNSPVLIQLAQLERDEAAIQSDEGKFDEALAKLASARAHLEKVVQRDPANYNAGFVLPQIFLAAALVDGKKGNPAKVNLDLAGAAIDRWAKYHPNDPEVPNLRLLWVRRQFWNARTLSDWNSALHYSDIEIAGYEDYLKNEPNNFIYRGYLQTALLNKATMLNNVKKHDEALAVLDRGLEVSAMQQKSDPSDIDSLLTTARIYFHRGRTMDYLQKPRDAVAALGQAMEIYRRPVKKDLAPAHIRARGEALYWLAKLSKASGDFATTKRSAAELAELAAKNPAMFAKPPTADWVAEAKRLAAG